MLTLIVAYFLYTYARPYKTTFVNIIEIALLAYLGFFLTLARDIQQQNVDNFRLDETSVDSCGKALPPIGPAWIVVGVLYFLPVTVLLFLLGRWLFPVGRKYWYVMFNCNYNVHVCIEFVLCYIYVICVYYYVL